MSKDYKKLYEEALERARDLHDNHPLGQPQTWMTCENIFPELRESEDEKIRKAIVKMISDIDGGFPFEKYGIIKKEALAWLEKQGEKESKEIDFADWDILNYIKDIVREHVKRDEEFNEIDNWLTTHYQEQKPAWSEEDERIRQCLIKDQENALDDVRNDKYGHSEIISDLKEMYRERIDWLKSLKPQLHWKPSEEQMEALNKAKNSPANYHGTRLELQSLYDDLKTLI